MINILYAGNYSVFDGIMLSVLSMVKYVKVPLDIYILTADVTELNEEYRPIAQDKVDCLQAIVSKYNLKHKVQLIYMDREFNKWINSSENKANVYTPFAFLRLFAHKVNLPDKVLYLDVDVMFNGNVQDIFDIDIKDYELGVVLDRYGRHFINPRYFNSGVMLMNLNKIRQTKLFDRVIEYCSHKKMAFPDQSALNKLCKYKLYLPRRFNEQGNLRKDTVIQHFSKRIKWLPFFHTQNIKPWNIEEVHNIYKWDHYDDIYDEFLRIKDW